MNIKKVGQHIGKVTEVSEPQEQLLTRFEDGTSMAVIQVRADATGGYAQTSSDNQDRDWSAPPGQRIANYEVKILDQSGDRDYDVSLTGDSGVHAHVHAKGHPRGEANNHSYIEIQVWVTLTSR
jgi:hypothetical protein